jgi:hypothetical protein
VLPPGSLFSAWFAKVIEVAKRSWKSALIICLIGIAAPQALVDLIGTAAGWSATVSVTSLSAALGSLLVGLLLTLVLSVAACYVAAAGWAAGTWALVREASTGQPADLSQAFGYGFKRAGGLFPWTILAALAVGIASVCFVLPGVYLAFGFSMFGFVAVFERGVNPLGRSFKLTHNSVTIGPTLGKVGILIGVYLVYTSVIGLIFGAFALAVSIGSGGVVEGIGSGFVQAVATLLSAPAFAVLLIGLLPTYAELRARETPLSTAQLNHDLG